MLGGGAPCTRGQVLPFDGPATPLTIPLPSALPFSGLQLLPDVRAAVVSCKGRAGTCLFCGRHRASAHWSATHMRFISTPPCSSGTAICAVNSCNGNGNCNIVQAGRGREGCIHLCRIHLRFQPASRQ